MPQGDPTYTGYVAGTPDTYLSTRRSSRVGPSSAPLETQEITHGLIGPISGRAVLVTPGTRVAFGSGKARRVFAQYGEGSSGVIVLGGVTVVAALATRNGFSLYGLGDWAEFDVTDLGDLYLDGTTAADWVSFNYWTL